MNSCCSFPNWPDLQRVLASVPTVARRRHATEVGADPVRFARYRGRVSGEQLHPHQTAAGGAGQPVGDLHPAPFAVAFVAKGPRRAFPALRAAGRDVVQDGRVPAPRRRLARPLLIQGRRSTGRSSVWPCLWERFDGHRLIPADGTGRHSCQGRVSCRRRCVKSRRDGQGRTAIRYSARRWSSPTSRRRCRWLPSRCEGERDDEERQRAECGGSVRT